MAEYLDEEGLTYLLENTNLGDVIRGDISVGGSGSGIEYAPGSIIFSATEINPSELYGGTWTYLSNTHMFQGWYLYRKDS